MSFNALLARQKPTKALPVESASPAVVDSPQQGAEPCLHIMDTLYRVFLTEWRAVWELTTWYTCDCRAERSASVQQLDHDEAHALYWQRIAELAGEDRTLPEGATDGADTRHRAVSVQYGTS